VKRPLRLAVIDIDGCLTPGVASEWNWPTVRAIRDINHRARRGEAVPAVTLCTGRQAPYVEVLMQAIGAHLPGVYENGCGLYFPDRFRFVEHPSITMATREAIATTKMHLYAKLVRPGLATLQPGKEVSLTLFPLPGTTLPHLRQLVADELTDQDVQLTIQTSASCVDVTPFQIDKGVGVCWLSEETGIGLEQMGGIGDSSSDLTFLGLVGRSAAPANALPEVRAAVDYVSRADNGDGVVEIMQHWSSQSAGARTAP
jgi:hydroxymethylpyrimidine pyrophosphatase-like HAD family hydrolase